MTGDREAFFAFESEAALIGAAMYAPADCEAALDGLRPEHFGDGVNARIWRAIRDVVRRGGTPDPAVIRNELAADQEFQQWGGHQQLWELWDSASTAAVADHAKAVGDASMRRRLEASLRGALERVGGTGDPLVQVSEIERELTGLLDDGGPADLVSARDASDEMFHDLDNGAVTGTRTGIDTLDERMGPMTPGELILLAGRSGMMKSAVCSRIALGVARSGLGFITINLEMSVAQMTRRHYADLAHERWGERGPEYKDIKRRKISSDQRAMLASVRAEFDRLPLKQKRGSALTVDKVRAMVRKQAAVWRKEGIKLGGVSIDHVGLMTVERPKSRYEDQTAIAIGLKGLAGDLECPILALVQINREVEKRENRRPQLHDLRDSGAWEENADTAIGIYREAYYALKEPEPQDNGGPGAMLKWAEWDRRRKSRDLEAIFIKVREGEEGPVMLWADPGRNAVRATAPGFWEG